jgi:solute carrier family 25 protein 42
MVHQKGHSVLGKDDQIPFEKKLSPVQLLFCGAVAGSVSKTVTAPIDRVKILYQVNTNRRFTPLNAMKTARTILRDSGVSGLWRGNGAAMYRVIPYSAISFATFDRFHNILLVLNSKQLESEVQNNAGGGSSASLRFVAGVYVAIC